MFDKRFFGGGEAGTTCPVVSYRCAPLEVPDVGPRVRSLGAPLRLRQPGPGQAVHHRHVQLLGWDGAGAGSSAGASDGAGRQAVGVALGRAVVAPDVAVTAFVIVNFGESEREEAQAEAVWEYYEG